MSIKNSIPIGDFYLNPASDLGSRLGSESWILILVENFEAFTRIYTLVKKNGELKTNKKYMKEKFYINL